MPSFLLLIWGDEQIWSAMDEQERRQLGDGHQAFVQAAGAGVQVGHELQPMAATRTVRKGADGGVRVTDGPFLETKEVVGGFYLIDADDIAAAVALASRLPEVSASHSGVEVRPVVPRADG